LRLNIHFVIQRVSAYEFETAIFNLDRIKTGFRTFGRDACCRLANTALIGVNRSNDTMHVIDVALAHVRRTDGLTEARFAIFYASTMIADFF
jgi:hypothetical protein